MSNPEQRPDPAEGQVKPRSRALLITLIVIVCITVVLAVGWYVLWKDAGDQAQEWWNDIKGSGELDSDSGDGSGGVPGGGSLDPGGL